MALRTRKVFGNFKKRAPPLLSVSKYFINFHLTMNLIAQKMQFYTTTNGLLSSSFGSNKKNQLSPRSNRGIKPLKICTSKLLLLPEKSLISGVL